MIDWTDAFDNSRYVPRAARLREDWATAAEGFRQSATQANLDLPYGPDERNRLDLFLPSNATKGLVVLVHGGYWHSMDKSFSSHMASGSLDAGWAVAIPSYNLAPSVSISSISREVAAAITFASEQVEGPVRLIGHSAGGHLVSRMLCTNSPLPDPVSKRLEKVVSVSGIHDLRPLLFAAMNDKLQLSDAEATSESPALLSPRSNVPVTFWVGAAERPELIRQTRLIAEAWGSKGAWASDVYEAGQDHFSVIENLCHAHSPLCTELLTTDGVKR